MIYELDKTNFEVIETFNFDVWKSLKIFNLEDPETKKNNVTLNEITMFQGRSFEAKKVIYISINDNLAQIQE